jgi:putative FmdB family regulatory protein
MVGPPRHPHLPGLTAPVDTAGAIRIAGSSRLCHDARAVPTYDYQCRECNVVTEVIHSMLEDGPAVCERCGGALRRVLFPAGIIFKGPGFYRTDSRAASSNGGSGSSSTSSDTASTPSAASDPAKPKDAASS